MKRLKDILSICLEGLVWSTMMMAVLAPFFGALWFLSSDDATMDFFRTLTVSDCLLSGVCIWFITTLTIAIAHVKERGIDKFSITLPFQK